MHRQRQTTRGLHLEQQFGGERRQSGHRHADDCGRRHRYRAYCDRDERQCDWDTQHRRRRGQSGGCTRHAYGAEPRIWRWYRYDQLQSHSPTTCLRFQSPATALSMCSWAPQYSQVPISYSGATNVNAGRPALVTPETVWLKPLRSSVPPLATDRDEHRFWGSSAMVARQFAITT